MVGPAGDTKLSAFWNMFFSKPPHFGNRGAAHVVVVPDAVHAYKKYTKTTPVYVIKKRCLRTSPCHTQLKTSGARTIKKHYLVLLAESEAIISCTGHAYKNKQ